MSTQEFLDSSPACAAAEMSPPLPRAEVMMLVVTTEDGTYPTHYNKIEMSTCTSGNESLLWTVCFGAASPSMACFTRMPTLPSAQFNSTTAVFRPFHWVSHAPKGAKRIEKERLWETIRDQKAAVPTSIFVNF
ncbi:hypothetical protein ARMGADRAFT_1130255 [Armillaria gallica]|uniref:Uncharacterized protein n=1 Tax=Armillaria gallica TaxID=47427 RepID=A0A2H3DSR7_ARMGA|nr:hypothetical protein ARMGADRAFT_1130255 [Armillaria gallica]